MTLLTPPHPSYLALDRAALGGLSNELRAHVEQCPECRSYLNALAEPTHASGWTDLQQRLERRRMAQRRSRWTIAPLAAAALALLFFSMRPKAPSGSESAPYVGAKGFPSVWIYVKRETETKLWDGKRTFHAGDRLRLKVDPGAFRHVVVYAAKGAAAPELLYEGDVIPGQITALPDAWELDAEPGAERLFVVLSHQPVTPRWAEWREGRVTPEATVLPFELPKSMLVDADASDGSP